MKRLILIDAHAIIHRAYHALPPLTTPQSEPINAVYGFTTMFLRILRELNPDYIAAAFDLPGPTFRHVAYERYKAQRPETPSDLSSQFEKVKEVLRAFKINIFEKEGYEADDIIGTMAEKLKKEKEVETFVVTGDMDTLQLVRPGLKVYAMRKGITDMVLYDEVVVKEKYGFGPSRLIDFKGLRGDPSDNISGVKGIGEKTATELIKKFGSVEEIYQAIKKGTKKISPAVQKRLQEGEEDARLSKELATIHTGVPLSFLLNQLRRGEDKENTKIRELFQRFGFTSILKRMDSEAAGVPEQPSLGSGSVVVKHTTHLVTLKDFGVFENEIKGKELGIILYNHEFFIISKDTKKIYQVDKNLFNKKETKEWFIKEKKLFVYDGKSIIHFLNQYGIIFSGGVFDIMLAAYLTETAVRDFSYLAIVGKELGRTVLQDPREEFMHFFDIVLILEKKIKDEEAESVFYNIESPLVPILAEMETRGILINSKFLGLLGEKVNKEIDALKKEIYKLSGTTFNINSPQQLSRVLFDELHIETRGLRKTKKGGVISTRGSELEKLKGAHAIIEKIIEYRELQKLKTTYLDVLPGLADPKTGRIHTTFNQTVTATGRLSSSDPNLQNIPILSRHGKEIRKAFVAGDGFLLASFDYSQIELRVAAHLANDKKMIEAFKKGLDIHRMTAAEVNNIPLDKVTPELRQKAKTLNFGVLYGVGPQTFAESTGMSREDAKKFIDEYFYDFSGIRDYIEDTKCFVEEHGYVQTLFGRRRYLPEIHSFNWQIKREAERMAINMPIQGTATGDIIKMAMTRVQEWIKKEGAEEKIRMLLQVHDELVFEIRAKFIKEVALKIKSIMERVAELKVPLVVDVKIGPNWGEQEKYKA